MLWLKTIICSNNELFSSKIYMVKICYKSSCLKLILGNQSVILNYTTTIEENGV